MRKHTVATLTTYLTPVVFAIALLQPMPSGAQTGDDPSNTLGLQQDRNYFSPESWEHLDTTTTNLVLTFIDLSLPGNAGRALQFQRSYNNTIDPTMPIKSRWSFGFPGMAMWIIEKSTVPPAMTFNDNPDLLKGYSPALVMADGSIQPTMFVQRPFKTNGQWVQATMQWVRSGQLYEYDRVTRTLYMPDGTICRYVLVEDPNFTTLSGLPILALSEFEDRFGNRVTITRETGIVNVTQHLGNGQTRTVTLTVDERSRVQSMLYEGKQWTYSYTPWPELRDIETVTPPLGAGWTFTYGNSFTDLTRITTPNGGRIEYDWVHVPAPPEEPENVWHYLHSRESFDRNGATPFGHWEVMWPDLSNLQTATTLKIVTPSGAMVVYSNGVMVPGTSHVMTGNYGLVEVKVYSDVNQPPSAWLERTTRTYDDIPVIRYDSDVWWATPELKERVIRRGAREYKTTFQYDTSVTSASPGLWNRHLPTQITEDNNAGLIRTTTRSYTYRSFPSQLIVGLPDSETVAVGAESFARFWSYNTNGFVTQSVTYGIPTTYQPDAFGNVQSVTSATGKTTSFTYSYGQVQNTYTPASVSTTRVVNPDGTIASETEAGRTTGFAYDALFRPTVVTPAGGSTPTIIEYDPNGAWVRTTRGSSQVTTQLNGFGWPTETTDSTGARSRTAYDAEGRVVQQGYPFNTSAPQGNQDIRTNITYDALGRVTQEINPDNSLRQYSYGADSVTIIDEEGRSTVHALQAFGNPDASRLLQLTDANNQLWLYAYNALGSLKSVQAPDGTMRIWSYNSANQLTSEQHPESGTTTYAYDAAGALATKTDANGTVFTFTRDGNDRVKKISTSSLVTDIFYEPGSDNRQSTTNGTTTTIYLYDAAGRLSQRQDAVGGKLFNSLFEYNADDTLHAIVYPDGRRIEYAYGPEQRLTQVSEPAAGRDHAFGLTYHPSGALTGYTSGNLIQTQVAYDETRRWIQSINAGPMSLTYGNYDDVGNLGSLTDSRPGFNQTFTYDSLDRLENATGFYGAPIVYAYNQHGNRIDANGSTYAYQPGTLRLSNFNGTPYTYDNNGNMLTAGGATYTYTKQNMLATAAVAGGTAAYGYDADDQRIKKTFGGSTTYYLRGLGGELLAEWKDPGTAGGTVRDYVYAGSRLISAVEKPTSSDPNAQCGIIVPGGPPVTVTAAANQNPCLTFTGWGDHIVGVLMTPVAPTTFSGGWTLRLRRVGGVLLDATSTWAASYLYLDALTLPADGTYRVEIDPYGTTSGTVTVQVFDVVNVTGTITPDGPAQTFSTTIPGQKVLVTFTGTVGRRYALFGERLAGSGCLMFPLRISKGQTTLANISTCGGSVLLETAAVTQGGQHDILVDPYVMDTGTIRLTLYDIDDDTTQAITPDGPAVTAGLTIGQRAQFTFTGIAGRRYAIKGERLTGSGCIFGLFRINKPTSGTLLPLGDTCGTNPFLETVVVTDPGVYTIVVDPDSTSTGTIRLTLYEVDSDVTGTLVINDPATPVSLTISQIARFTFAGVQGQQVTVRITGNTMGYTPVYLKKLDGTTITWNASSGSSFNLSTQTLQGTDTYEVWVDPSGMATGSISVRVTSP